RSVIRWMRAALAGRRKEGDQAGERRRRAARRTRITVACIAHGGALADRLATARDAGACAVQVESSQDWCREWSLAISRSSRSLSPGREFTGLVQAVEPMREPTPCLKQKSPNSS